MKALVIDASVWVSAADSTDPLSEASRAFLSGVVARELPIALPEFAQLEIGCALARRLRNAQQGRDLAERMLASPLVTSHSLNRTGLRDAVQMGTSRFLRAGDALYAALAEGLGGSVVAWDAELIKRAGAMTPRDWLERQSPV